MEFFTGDFIEETRTILLEHLGDPEACRATGCNCTEAVIHGLDYMAIVPGDSDGETELFTITWTCAHHHTLTLKGFGHTATLDIGNCTGNCA